MLSGRFWRSKFGSSPEILGSLLTLDGTGYTVIGVVPENFYFCCESMNFELGDVYVPIGSGNASWLTARGFRPGIRGIGRMKPGVTIEQARADMRSEEHTSELQSRLHLVCRLLLENTKISNN